MGLFKDIDPLLPNYQRIYGDSTQCGNPKEVQDLTWKRDQEVGSREGFSLIECICIVKFLEDSRSFNRGLEDKSTEEINNIAI